MILGQAAPKADIPEPRAFGLEGGRKVMSLAVETYKQLLCTSGLVPPAQLEQAIQQLNQRFPTRPLDSQVLSQHLLEKQLITPWQNSKLMKGCSKGFFIGRYKLLAHLGTGGMSRVYLAIHTMMKRRVAIKVLNQKLTESPSHLERFLRESQAAAALDHPNVVRAYDVDCDRGLYYFVMEYVEGPTLQSLVEKGGPLAYNLCADYIRQSALGLQHAHEASLVHRDVKPGNLLVNGKGVVKVLDLGMVRLTSDEVRSITIQFNESMLGTADYLAPEQALDSHHVDGRADIYALGCTFYFCLTGHPPFPDGSMAMRLMRHQSEEPAPVANDRPDVPEELVAVLSKMMAKNPDTRYQTSLEVANDLQAWLDSQRPAGGNVLGEIPGAAQPGDTVAGSAPYTVVGDQSPPHNPLPGTHGGQAAEMQHDPAQILPTEAPKPRDSAPSLSDIQSASSVSLGGRPEDYNTWKYRHFENAMIEADPKFSQAIATLCRKHPGHDKVVAFLVRLISSPAAASNPLTPDVLRSLVDHLGLMRTKTAVKTLMRIVVGAVNLQVNDPLAVRLALDALAKTGVIEAEKFLAEVIANAEDARPAGKTAITPADLRQRAVEALQGRVSDRLAQELRTRLSYRSLNPPGRQAIESVLGSAKA